MELFSAKTVVILAGLAIGVAFGAIGRWSGFCVRGAIEDGLTKPDAPRLRGYLLALVVALVGVQLLIELGLIDVAKTLYMANAINIVGALIGGALFGIGMVLAGGCGARLLVLAGGGNLRSLVVLVVFALVAYASMRGVLAFARGGIVGLGAVDATALGAADNGVIGLLAGLAPASAIRWLLTGALALAAIGFALRRRIEARHLIGGLAVGLLVVAGFAATGILGNDGFEALPVESLTVVKPLSDSLIFLLTSTGSKIDFGIATIFAIPLGAFLVAWRGRQLRLEGFGEPRQMLRYIGAGALMGFGGVVAGGCTIGHGLTGAALLSPTSLLAILGIAAGAILTMTRRQARADNPQRTATALTAAAAISH